jgi:hypothetical protein
MRSAADTKASVRKDSIADLMRQPTIRVEDAAVVLAISRGLAYDLARRGELPGVCGWGIREGRACALENRAVSQWPEENSTPPANQRGD